MKEHNCFMVCMAINCLDFSYLVQVPVVIDVKDWLVVLKTRSEFDKFVNWRRHLNDLDYNHFQYHVMQGFVFTMLHFIKYLTLPVLEPNLYSQLLD